MNLLTWTHTLMNFLDTHPHEPLGLTSSWTSRTHNLMDFLDTHPHELLGPTSSWISWLGHTSSWTSWTHILMNLSDTQHREPLEHTSCTGLIRLPFMQGHTYLNHENNNCSIISETVQAMLIKFPVKIVRLKVYNIIYQSDECGIYSLKATTASQSWQNNV